MGATIAVGFAEIERFVDYSCDGKAIYFIVPSNMWRRLFSAIYRQG